MKCGLLQNSFFVLLQSVCAGEVSVVIEIEMQYNLVSISRGNTMERQRKLKMFNYHYFLLLNVTFSDNLQNLWTIYCSSKTVNGNMKRTNHTKVNFPTWGVVFKIWSFQFFSLWRLTWNLQDLAKLLTLMQIILYCFQSLSVSLRHT